MNSVKRVARICAGIRSYHSGPKIGPKPGLNGGSGPWPPQAGFMKTKRVIRYEPPTEDSFDWFKLYAGIGSVVAVGTFMGTGYFIHHRPESGSGTNIGFRPQIAVTGFMAVWRSIFYGMFWPVIVADTVLHPETGHRYMMPEFPIYRKESTYENQLQYYSRFNPWAE